MPARHKQLQYILLLAACYLLLPALALGHGISAADKQAMLAGGNLQYIWLGATHMLTGLDHLLFLFGVIFFLTGFRDIVKFITAFTMGHSITLLLATVFGITANYYLIDAVIALSVMYKGFENIDGFKKYMGVESPNLLLMVFGFGLIHGFGLSTRLQQLPLGTDGMITRILSFNVGVEAGQIAALAIMLLLVSSWRKAEAFAQLSTTANVALIIAGSLLFLFQMHGYMHTKYPDDFGFSKDNHHHEHLRMQHKDDARGTKGHSHEHKGHSHGHKGHSHGTKAHSHGTKSHNHGTKSHSPKPHVHKHGKKPHAHPQPPGHNPKDHHGPQPPTKPRPHGHSHNHGHPHAHSHGPGSRPASRVPQRRKVQSRGKAPARKKGHGHHHGPTGHSHSTTKPHSHDKGHSHH